MGLCVCLSKEASDVSREAQRADGKGSRAPIPPARRACSCCWPAHPLLLLPGLRPLARLASLAGCSPGRDACSCLTSACPHLATMPASPPPSPSLPPRRRDGAAGPWCASPSSPRQGRREAGEPSQQAVAAAAAPSSASSSSSAGAKARFYDGYSPWSIAKCLQSDFLVKMKTSHEASIYLSSYTIGHVTVRDYKTL
ncbi:uncharacterized protein LOC107983057 isoform X3 [Anolis carolinensis]|uniref:uncharacterized protein LOC107983057 isoform X3 n=1 Tax=Anolis carolinensis TaxID=28377 RepID=UPI002F2B6D8A